MASAAREHELSDTILEIGSKLHPRRYRRFKDLRTLEEACEWAEGLDWRNNPYDRWLLRREILHYLESTICYEPGWNIYEFANRAVISAELDQILDDRSGRMERLGTETLGVFLYALTTLRWDLAFKHGRIRYSALTKALANFPGGKTTRLEANGA